MIANAKSVTIQWVLETFYQSFYPVLYNVMSARKLRENIEVILIAIKSIWILITYMRPTNGEILQIVEKKFAVYDGEKKLSNIYMEEKLSVQSHKKW